MHKDEEIRIIHNPHDISINGITIAIGNFGFRKTNTTNYLSGDLKLTRVL